ncbi:MAG: serine/threonine protein kinase [Planctomycetaceae bacterium]
MMKAGHSMGYEHMPLDDVNPFIETRPRPMELGPVPRTEHDDCVMDHVRAAELQSLLPPALQHEYNVLELVSRPGKFPLLLKMWHKSLRRPHAAKIWESRASGDQLTEEGRIQSLLSGLEAEHSRNPAVPQVQRFDYCQQSSQWYLVMSWVEGQNLSVVARTAGREPCVCKVLHFATLAEDVQRMHDQGILHGDITPMNVLWCSVGDRLYLIDYGNSGAGPTRILANWTDNYLAPEMLQTRSATYATELWALAAVMVTTLCGEPPTVQGQLPAALDVSGALRAVLLQALHTDPSRRYRSCGDFAVALRHAAAQRGAAVEVEPLSTREDCQRSLKHWFPGVLQAWESGGRGGVAFKRIAPGRLSQSEMLPAEISNSVPFHLMGEPLRFEDYRDLSGANRWQWPAAGAAPAVQELRAASLVVCEHLTTQFRRAVQLPRRAELEYAIRFLKCAGASRELQAIAGSGEVRHYLLSEDVPGAAAQYRLLRVQRLQSDIVMRESRLEPDWVCNDLQTLLVVHGHGGV